MTNAPKDAGVTATPALDEDLELDQPDTDAVAGGRMSHTKTKAGKDAWQHAKCLAD